MNICAIIYLSEHLFLFYPLNKQVYSPAHKKHYYAHYGGDKPQHFFRKKIHIKPQI